MTGFDAELLRRYDRSGPRYTSYPTAPQFEAGFGEEQFREAVARSNVAPAPRPLSAYVHVPYCLSPCFYCGCNRIITRDRSRSQPYLRRLAREIATVGDMMGRDRELVQLHFGGGTPNFLQVAELRETVEFIGDHFRFAHPADRDFSIELDPRWVEEGDIRALAAAGFNRASLGVQDLDPAVQQAVNRIQSAEQTLGVIEACRASGFRSVNVDLIYGLPAQTPTGFSRTLDVLLEARPDRLAVYGYAHLPNLFKAQRQIAADALPGPEMKLHLLGLAIEKLAQAGYRYIGMDHFALPGDDLAVAQEAGTLGRNFMGYTTHADCDLIGFGVSAISRIADTFSQNHRDAQAWESAIDAGRLPVARGVRLSRDDQIRADAIQALMCHGRIDIRALEQRFAIQFGSYFAEELRALVPLARDQLVELAPEAITATSRGRLLLRVIAACFDRYLRCANDGKEAARYSKVV